MPQTRRGINDSDELVPVGSRPNADVVGAHRPAPKRGCCYYCVNTTRDQKERVAKRVCGLGVLLVVLLVVLTAVLADVSDPTDTYLLRAGETRLIAVPAVSTYASMQFAAAAAAAADATGSGAHVFTSPAAQPPTLTGPTAFLGFSHAITAGWQSSDARNVQPFHLYAGANATTRCAVTNGDVIEVLAFHGQSNWEHSGNGVETTYAFATSSGAVASLTLDTTGGGSVTADADYWLVARHADAVTTTGWCNTTAWLTTFDITGFEDVGVVDASSSSSLSVTLDGASDVNYVVLRGPTAVPTPTDPDAGAQYARVYSVAVTARRRMFASATGRIAILWIVAAVVVGVWICVELYVAKRAYEPYERDQALMGQTIGDAFE